MKNQANNNSVTTFIRQIFNRFTTTKTSVPQFDMEQTTTEHNKKCIVKQREKGELIMPIIDPKDIPSATDYGSTY